MNIIDMLQQEAEKDQNVNTEAPVVETVANEVAEPAAELHETEVNSAEQGTENTQAEPAPAEEQTTTETGAQQSEQPQVATKTFVSEEAARFNDFVSKTGKEDYNEFKFWQKPTDEVDEDELLRKFLSEKEGMTEKEIAFELKRLEKTESEFDDEFWDDDEITEKEVQRERYLRKAKEWHQAEQERINSSTESVVPQRMTLEEYNQMVMQQHETVYKQNLTKVYETIPTVTGLKINIAGNEKLGIAPLNVEYTPDEEFRSEMQAASSDIGTVINKFYENGYLKDAKGWIETVATASPKNLNKLIQFAVEQAVLADRVNRSNIRRNVTPDNYQPISGSGTMDSSDFDEFLAQRRKY